MGKRKRTEAEILESVERLLIMFMVKNGVNSEDIAKATQMASRTIRNLYPKGGTYEKK